MNDLFWRSPKIDQIEISIFGSGYGESILIHLGLRKWIVVDSFINFKTGNPIILDYFNKINESPNNIIFIFATHWHDDHIKGLSEILKRSDNSTFVCSEALKHKEFLTLISSERTIPYFIDSGISEFNNILKILELRNSKNNLNYKFAIQDRLLFKDNILNKDYFIYSLSPSDNTVSLSKTEIVDFLPKEYSDKIKIIKPKMNQTSVVLLIQIDDIFILLGADLEKSQNVGCGWDIINDDSQSIKNKKINYFKIPHHGSKSAYSEKFWLTYIDKNTISFLTPFIRGSNSIPSNEEIRTILKHTQNSFITSYPNDIKKIKRDIKVEKMIDQVVKNISPINTSYGHIRIRIDMDNKNDNIELFEKASKLTSINLK